MPCSLAVQPLGIDALAHVPRDVHGMFMAAVFLTAVKTSKNYPGPPSSKWRVNRGVCTPRWCAAALVGRLGYRRSGESRKQR